MSYPWSLPQLKAGSRNRNEATDSPVYPFQGEHEDRVESSQSTSQSSMLLLAAYSVRHHIHAPFILSSKNAFKKADQQTVVERQIYSSHIKNSCWPDANTLLAKTI